MAVLMYHPNIATLAEAVDEAQFEQVHEPRGWRRAPLELAEIVDQYGIATADLTTVDRNTLLHIAASRGVDDAAEMDNDELAEVLSGGVVIDTEPLASGATVDADKAPTIGDPHVPPPASGLTTTATPSGTTSGPTTTVQPASSSAKPEEA